MRFLIVAILLLATVSSVHAENWKKIGVSTYPQYLQKLFDYDARTDGQPVYIGMNEPGAATSADGWLIQKLLYDGSDQVTSIKVVVGIWDNRASLTYE